MVEKFKNLLKQHQDLRPFLVKVCHRYRKKGVLTRAMKFGQELSSRELAGLHAMFGMQALTISGSDEVRISFDRFFGNMALKMRKRWIRDLHSCLDLTLRDDAHEKRLHYQETELFLERLRIGFPELKGVHQALAENTGSLNRLLSSERNIQDSYFKAAEITRFLRINRDIITFSELGARFCNNSKSLRNTGLSKLVESWLATMEEGDGTWPDRKRLSGTDTM